MSKEIYKIFEKELVMPEDLTAYNWYDAGYSTIYINYASDDVYDLFESGQASSYDIYSGPIERDGRALYTLYDGEGSKFQAIFSLDKKQDEDKYWQDMEDE